MDNAKEPKELRGTFIEERLEVAKNYISKIWKSIE